MTVSTTGSGVGSMLLPDDLSGRAGPAGGEFRPTQWSLVLCAGGQGSDVSTVALKALCRTYWKPGLRLRSSQGLPKVGSERIYEARWAEAVLDQYWIN